MGRGASLSLWESETSRRSQDHYALSSPASLLKREHFAKVSRTAPAPQRLTLKEVRVTQTQPRRYHNRSLKAYVVAAINMAKMIAAKTGMIFRSNLRTPSRLGSSIYILNLVARRKAYSANISVGVFGI